MRSLLPQPTSDLAIVLRDLGMLVPVVGVMALLSLIIPAVYGESFAYVPMLLTAAISFCLGAALYFPFRDAGYAKLKHGMIIAGFGWLLVAALGSLPFTLMFLLSPETAALPQFATLKEFANPLNGFFEAVSGYTGTGLTMAARADLLPATLQWWRSFIEWIGGMGVIVLMLAILAGPRPGAAKYSLYYAEARGEKIQPSISSTLRTMWWIFLLYTAVSTIALWGGGNANLGSCQPRNDRHFYRRIQHHCEQHRLLRQHGHRVGSHPDHAVRRHQLRRSL